MVRITSSNGTFSALLALYEGNSPVTTGFPSQRPVTQTFGVFWTNTGANNREAGDMTHHRAHCNVIVMLVILNKFPALLKFPRFLWLSKECLNLKYHDHNGNFSMHICFGNTFQLWMRINGSNIYFYKKRNIRNRWIMKKNGAWTKSTRLWKFLIVIL